MSNDKKSETTAITMVVFPDGRFAYVTNTRKAVQAIAEVWAEQVTDEDVELFQKHQLCITETTFAVMPSTAELFPLNQIQYPWTFVKNH